MSADLPDDMAILEAHLRRAQERVDADRQAAVIAERERVLGLIEAHIELARSAPLSGPSELIHLEGLIARIRKGEP